MQYILSIIAYALRNTTKTWRTVFFFCILYAKFVVVLSHRFLISYLINRRYSLTVVFNSFKTVSIIFLLFFSVTEVISNNLKTLNLLQKTLYALTLWMYDVGLTQVHTRPFTIIVPFNTATRKRFLINVCVALTCNKKKNAKQLLKYDAKQSPVVNNYQHKIVRL